MLVDGTIVAETPEEGLEFYIKDGMFDLSICIWVLQKFCPRVFFELTKRFFL